MEKETKILKTAENAAFALFSPNEKKTPIKNLGTMPPSLPLSSLFYGNSSVSKCPSQICEL